MIRAAELRNVVQQVEGYRIAVHVFRDKYFAKPGDMTNAYAFWGADCAATEAECNGDGDGLVLSEAPDNFQEEYQFWNHLSRADLISGEYTGAEDASGNGVFGINLPETAKSGAGLIVTVNEPHTASNSTLYYQIGGRDNVPQSGCADWAFMETAEAFKLDTKFDDALPKTGRFLADDSGGGITTTCVESATNEYTLSAEGIQCRAFYDTK